MTREDSLSFHPVVRLTDMRVPQPDWAKGDGDLFYLDMGDPVNVADLARKLIHLSGFSVREPGVGGGDIEIRFIGLRPGEKLFEELLVDGTSTPTGHPRIFRADAGTQSWSALDPYLAQLVQIVAAQDVEGLKGVLRQLVEAYGAVRASAGNISVIGE